jgi:hypothetical protein
MQRLFILAIALACAPIAAFGAVAGPIIDTKPPVLPAAFIPPDKSAPLPPPAKLAVDTPLVLIKTKTIATHVEVNVDSTGAITSANVFTVNAQIDDKGVIQKTVPGPTIPVTAQASDTTATLIVQALGK